MQKETTHYFMIDKDSFNNGAAERCSVISLDATSDNPFRTAIFHTRYEANPCGFGSIIKMNDHNYWVRTLKYNEHNYDYVVVLEKATDKLVVYGNKTGERTINSPIKAERGDYLLLHTKHNTIIHNVTRAKMKFEIQKMLINFKEK